MKLHTIRGMRETQRQRIPTQNVPIQGSALTTALGTHTPSRKATYTNTTAVFQHSPPLYLTASTLVDYSFHYHIDSAWDVFKALLKRCQCKLAQRRSLCYMHCTRKPTECFPTLYMAYHTGAKLKLLSDCTSKHFSFV